MRSISVSIIFYLFFCSCTSLPFNLSTGVSHNPYVVQILPSEGEALTTQMTFVMDFSVPILSESVDGNTVFVMRKSDYETYDAEEWDDLYDDVKSGDVDVVASRFSVSSDGKQITFTITGTLVPATDYVLVALPIMTSVDHYPLNQSVLAGLTRQFTSVYSWTSTATSESSVVEASADANENHDEAVVAEEGVAEQTSTPSEPFDFNRVFVSEVVTDPQQDHNDTSGGDGVLFNGTPGSGTVGSTDEYIELYNGTGTEVDLTGWSLVMTDGSDVSAALDDSSWQTYFSKGGNVAEFLAGEIAVFGNPTGDLKNTIIVSLYNAEAESVDELDIADGNADTVTNEAYELNAAGEFEMSPATPGEVTW